MNVGAATREQQRLVNIGATMKADAARLDLPFGQERSHAPTDALEQRLGAVVEAYDSQGSHRSGTDVDHRSAEWLIDCARRLGVEAALEPFALNRIDPQSCFLRVA